jgi:hypothetical protein
LHSNNEMMSQEHAEGQINKNETAEGQEEQRAKDCLFCLCSAAEWLPLIHPSVLNPAEEINLARLTLQLGQQRLHVQAGEPVDDEDPELEQVHSLQNPVVRSNLAVSDLAVTQATSVELGGGEYEELVWAEYERRCKQGWQETVRKDRHTGTRKERAQAHHCCRLCNPLYFVCAGTGSRLHEGATRSQGLSGGGQK